MELWLIPPEPKARIHANKTLCNRTQWHLYSHRVFGKKHHCVGKLSTSFPLSVRSLFYLFSNTHKWCMPFLYVFKNKMYAGYVKVAPGKPQTGRVKLKISPGTGLATKFSLRKGKNPLIGFHWVCYRGMCQYPCQKFFFSFHLSSKWWKHSGQWHGPAQCHLCAEPVSPFQGLTHSL